MPTHIQRIHYILATVAVLAFLHQHVPFIRDYKVLERFLATVVASSITEYIGSKFEAKFDFGVLTYLLAIVYPPMFTIASYTVRKHASDIPYYERFQAMLLGSEYSIRFRRDIDFKNIMSEHSAVSDINAVASETRRSNYIREGYVGVGIIMAFVLLHGHDGIMVGGIMFLIYLMLQGQKGKDEKIFTQDVSPIEGRRGVYAIELVNLWQERHVGVGYLENGTLTTKYHITNGQPICFNGRSYNPSYYSTEADIVTYGAPPCMVNLADGDDIVVALSGPYSDVIVNYATKVSLNEEGYIMFTGRRSMPGTSGSPFFKVSTDANGEKEFQFAGCIGWACNSHTVPANEVVEIAKNTGIGTSNIIGIGEIVQRIDHPGSGKTRDIAKVIQAGLNIYGRVYAAGPTRGVANELLKAYEANPIEGLIPRVLIKDTQNQMASSKLTISTHGTLLSLLLKRDHTINQPALWILDESHFPDRNTQALKHYLRHHIRENKMKASLYEMTATAYHINTRAWVYADGSNYPIKDTIMNESDMIKSILDEERKTIVFVTAIEGSRQTTSKSLAAALKAKGKKVIEINRRNFTTSYPLAKKGDFDFVLTTNISECGVNLDVEVCYDFQRNPRPLVYAWNDIRVSNDEITIGQLIQRRGRVGRRKEGEYIAPATRYQLKDVRAHDVLHLDVNLFNKDYEIHCMEPTFLNEEAAMYSCTREQIMYIFAGGERHTVESFLTLSMVMNSRGETRAEDEIMDQVMDWDKGSDVDRTEGDRTVSAAFWDDRDSAFYWQWKNILEQQPVGEVKVPRTMRRRIFDLCRAVRNRGVWVRDRQLDHTPDASSDEAAEEDTSNS